MHVSPRPIAAASLVLLAGALAGTPALGAGVTLSASDETGVTLRVTAPEGTLEPAGDGRFDLVVPGAKATRVPGRPRLPTYGTLIALPPGARATARVVASAAETEREVRLAPAGCPSPRRSR
jgi:hypothetical protein